MCWENLHRVMQAALRSTSSNRAAGTTLEAQQALATGC